MMARNPLALAWARQFQRQWRTLAGPVAPAARKRRHPAGQGTWTAGIAMGPAGARRFRLYRPSGVKSTDRRPLLVMLHGCGQDATSFALCTRMNLVAEREGFLVLYPEQDRLANPQACWNWFDTSAGRAYGEASLILAAIDQVCVLYPVDRARVAAAGLSAGASMAALLVTRHPRRFKAIAMHSGIPPGTAHSGFSALQAMHGHRPTPPLDATATMMAESWPPLLVIHGRADHTVAISNGHAAAQAWSDAAGAHGGASRTVQRGHRYPSTVTDFERLGLPVATLVEVDQLGHAWSGGAPGQAYGDARGPDASRMIWTFASRQIVR